MNIAIIITTHNRKLYLSKILEQLKNQECCSDIKYKVIVINDGSNDGTIEMLKEKYPDTISINGDGAWWWTKSINIGITKAKELGYDFVLLLNDDGEINKDYIRILTNDYKKLKGLSVLGSSSLTINKPNKVEFAGSVSFSPWLFKTIDYVKPFTIMKDDFSGVYPTWTLNGRGTLFPIKIFELIGMLDEKLVQYGSDYEIIIRARKNDIPVYISWNARIYNHTMMTSEGASYRKTSLLNFFRSFYNKYSVNSIRKTAYLYLKHGKKFLLPIYIFYFIIGTTKAYLFKY